MSTEAASEPGPMRTESVAIRAHSERRAMDWSLVLASQGIEVVLDREPMENVWALRVAPADEERARAAIRQFRRENRGSAWHHEVPGSNLLFHSGVLLWVFAIALCHAAQGELHRGLFDSRAVRAGEWWRAFTALWLHADLAHLASNAVFGALILGLAMARFGAGVALLGTLLAGAAANGIGLLFRPEAYTGLGASGLIMAALGMLASQSVPLWRAGRRGTKFMLTGLGTGALLFVLVGVDPSADVLVHAAGFGLGVPLGALAAQLPVMWRRAASRSSAGLFALLSAGTWLMALYYT
jgi:rhomboid protease GluP